MLAFGNKFSLEAVLFSIICKGVEIEIKPVKRLSDTTLVLHLIVKLTILIICKVNHQTSILFLEEISQVT